MVDIKSYSALQLLSWAKILAKSTFGKKQSYELSFEQDPDGRWYIVFPGWPLDRSHLQMVAGADDMLDLLDTSHEHLVKVSVIPAKEKAAHEGYFQLTCIKSSLSGGAFYTAQGLEGWGDPHAIREKELWLCPVTLCVLGHYPKYIYVKKIGE